MPGWELYRTASSGEDFGEWSDCSDTEVVGSDTREVESELRYRHRDKETTTDSSSSKSGWTLYDTTYTWGEYRNWSKWSPSIVANSDSRKVKTKTQYSYRHKEYTTSSNATLDGWTYYDNTYSEWGNVHTSSTKPTESNTLRITSVTQTGWGYYHYCNYYANGGNNRNVDSIPYGSPNVWHSYTSSFTLHAESFPDKGGNQSYGGSGSGAHAGGYGFCVWFRNTGTDTYAYTYETRTATHHFYRYPDKWSSWSDTLVPANSDREVKTQALYRYKDRSQVPTYHFWKWGEWSDWEATAVSGADSREVETSKFYRNRDIVKETVYYFRRWTEWSEFTNVEIAKTDNVEVEEKTQYRYKLK